MWGGGGMGVEVAWRVNKEFSQFGLCCLCGLQSNQNEEKRTSGDDNKQCHCHASHVFE